MKNKVSKKKDLSSEQDHSCNHRMFTHENVVNSKFSFIVDNIHLLEFEDVEMLSDVEASFLKSNSLNEEQFTILDYIIGKIIN